jgi:23S rRNA (cytosine1962-C5)-methyltransferase
MHQIMLLKGREQSLLRKHPWVFSGAVKKKPTTIEDGDLVQVLDFQSNILGIGLFQDGSIMVRMLAFENREIDQNYWNEKIANACAFRKNVLSFPNDNTNAYRLFHGEGDGASGLVIDIYGSVAVIQCHNIGIHRMLPSIVNAIVYNMSEVIKTVFNKSKDTLPEKYASSLIDGIVYGTPSNEGVVKENGAVFHINWDQGQKTGFFLDQRDNRALVGKYSKEKTVLNCFCYTGGFSVYAGLNEALHVSSVDISAKAMALTDQNIDLNGIKQHTSHTANVLEYLSNHEVQYDIVIVDPPAFAKSMSKRHNAVQAYKRLNAMAIKMVKPGGLLFTFSCSQVVTTQLFYDTIVAAGIEAGKDIRVMQHLSQGADHPVNLFHPEGHYLKGLMLAIGK